MTEINTGKLCRICLKESNFFSNIYIEQLLDGTLIFEVVNDLLQLDIEFEDDYPQFLCSECYNKILEFELFKRTAHEGKAVLLYSEESFENNEIESEDDTEICGRSVAVQNEVYLVPVKVEDYEAVPAARDPLEVDVKNENEDPLRLEEDAKQMSCDALSAEGHELDFQVGIKNEIEDPLPLDEAAMSCEGDEGHELNLQVDIKSEVEDPLHSNVDEAVQMSYEGDKGQQLDMQVYIQNEMEDPLFIDEDAMRISRAGDGSELHLQRVAVDGEIENEHYDALLPTNYHELILQKYEENEMGTSRETEKSHEMRLWKNGDSESQRMLKEDWKKTEIQQLHSAKQRLDSVLQNKIENEEQNTGEVQESRLQNIGDYNMQIMSQETVNRKELRLQKQRERKRQKKLQETEEERQLRLQKAREYDKDRRTRKYLEQFESKLQEIRACNKRRRSQETEEGHKSGLQNKSESESHGMLKEKCTVTEFQQRHIEAGQESILPENEAEETEELQLSRLLQMKALNEQRKAQEVMERRELTLRRQREYEKQRWSKKKMEPRELRLEKQREYNDKWMSRKTVEQLESRLEQIRERKRQKMLRESEEEHKMRLQRLRESAARKRLRETEEQREMRLKRRRESDRRRKLRLQRKS